MWDDGNSLGPKEIHAYLTRVMYNRRNKFDPLWNSLVLGGVKKGPKGDEKYLGMVYYSFKQTVLFFLLLPVCRHFVLCLFLLLFRLT